MVSGTPRGAAIEAAHGGPGRAPSTERVRLLIVDDLPANLLAMDVILRRPDYEIVAVGSPLKALETAQKDEFAVILLDVMMPGMDGFELTRRIKAGGRNRETPVLLVTAMAGDPAFVNQGYACGAADYLTKPLNDVEVRAKVGVFVELHRTKQALRALNHDLEARATERAKDLAASNERFRLLVEGVEEYGLIQMDRNGVFVTWNAGAERLLGYGEDEIIGVPFKAIFTPEDRASGVPEQELTRAAETGKADESRWHLRRNGSRFWAHGTTTPLKDEAGSLRGFVKVLRDETARMQTEEALKRSERRFRALIDNSLDALSLLSRAGDILYAAPATQRIFGYTPEESTSLNLLALVHPDDRERTRELLADLLRAPGKTVRTKLRLRHADGRWLWVEGSGTNLLDDPAVGGIVANYRDVTEQVASETARRASEENYRASFELAAVGQAHFHPATHRILRANRRLAEVTGYTLAELQQLRFEDITHPDDRPDDLEKFRQLMAGETDEYQNEKRYIRKDGETIWVAVNTTLVRDPAGVPLHTISVIQDVSGRRAAADELRHSQERLELALDSAALGTWAFEPGRRTVTLDDRCRKLLALAGPAGYRAVMAAIAPGDRGAAA